MHDNANASHPRPGRLTRTARDLSLCAALALTCAHVAHAQGRADVKDSPAAKTSGAPEQAREKSGEDDGASAAVRERRVQGKTEGPAAKDAPAPKSEAATAVAVEEAKAAAGEPSSSVAGEDAAVVELKTKIGDAKSEAERARLRRELAELLAGRGRKSEAVDTLRAMLGEERFDPASFYNIGNAFARLGEPNAAVEAYRKAITQRRGNYSRAQHNLGVVLTRLGRWEEAQEALAAAIRLEGGVYPDASYNMGRLHAARGEAGLAIGEWTRALARQPEHAEAAVALARALADDGDPERGLAVLDAFSKRFSGRGAQTPHEIEIARGEILAAINLNAGADGRAPESRAGETNAPRARASSSSSARTSSVDQETYDLLRRARAARDAGRNEEAVALYRRVVERREGYFPPANLELGFSLANLGRNPEAIETLEAVASKDGARYPVAFYHLGRLYERTGDLARAREAFTRAAALYGDTNPQLLLDMSRVSEKLGDARGAADAMETYVQSTARTGDTPEWARERLAKLRQKLAPAVASEK